MKRLLLPASALVLVVTACGAGARPAPRLTQVEARLPTVHALVARREHAALREARRLEREFVPPPGARRDRARRDHGGILNQPGPAPFGEFATARRFWEVHKPLAEVIGLVGAPRGFRLAGSGSGKESPGGSSYLMQTLAWPDTSNPTRLLDETMVARPGGTVIRVDANVAWVYPRSPTEMVPVATRAIVVSAPKVSRTVTSPAKVARVIRWFDALPVFPPGMGIACPAVIANRITLSFRGAEGTRLARATVPATFAGVCDPIAFRIGAKTKKPLIDQAGAPSFARRLERLVGVHIPRRITPTR